MGWFNARLKNLRGAQKRLAAKTNPLRRSGSLVVDQRYADQRNAEDVIYLQSLVVSGETKDTFMEKLNSTRRYRMEMLLDKNINLKEQFPYFFTNPELVI